MKKTAKLLPQILVMLAAAILLVSCGPKNTESDPDGFIANSKSTNNYLLTFLGDSDGLTGPALDMGHMQQAFGMGPARFQMPGPYQGGWQYPSKAQMLQIIGQYAGQMLAADQKAWANLQRGGTLFIYITSHGADDGSTAVAGGNELIRSSEIASAIRTARGNVPLERFVIFFDTCFAGQNVIGSAAINEGTGSPGGYAPPPVIPAIARPQSGDGSLDSYMTDVLNGANSVRGFYKSGIFIGSSLPNEESSDTSTGGPGTSAFIQAVSSAMGGATGAVGANPYANNGGAAGAVTNSAPGATIQQVLTAMISNASQFQTPTWCVEPRELADDYFFDPPSGYLPANPANAAATGANNRVCSRPSNGVGY